MASMIVEKNIGWHLYAKGSRAEVELMAQDLARNQGLRSWSIAALNAQQDRWALYI